LSTFCNKVGSQLLFGVFNRNIVCVGCLNCGFSHGQCRLRSDIQLIRKSFGLLNCIGPSRFGSQPGFFQCSIVGIGAVSRGVSSSFCIESGKDGRNNGYGGETCANATHNKLAQGVGSLGLRNEIRALRDAVRLTTNSKAFPVAAREAFLASMAGICSGGLAVGIPLWIAFGWRRRRNHSKGRN